MFKQINVLPAALVIQLINDGKIQDNHRVIWRAKDSNDNIIFLATNKTLISMIEDTTEPTDLFEIWQDEQENNLKT